MKRRLNRLSVKNRKLTFMTRMFLSYMAGTILLVSTTFVVIHHFFITMIAQQMQDSVDDTIQRFQSSLDYQISAMDRIATILRQDYDISLRSDLSAYDSYKISQKLRHYASVNQNLADISILDESNGRMVSSSGVSDIDDYFYLYYGFRNGDEIPAQVLRAEEPAITVFFNTSESIVFPGDYSFYIVPDTSGKKFLFTVNKKYFANAVQDLSFGFNGYLYILDDQFQPMTELSLPDNSFYAGTALQVVEQMKEDNHSSARQDLGNGIYARLEPSTVHMWNYCVISDCSGMYDQLQGIYLVYFFSLGGILAVGLAVNLLVSKFNCIPLRRIVKSLVPQRTDQPALDDLRLITNAFEDIRSENTALSQKIIEKNENIASQVFRLLLVGAVTGRQAHEELEKVGVHLQTQFCALSIIHRKAEDSVTVQQLADQLSAAAEAPLIFSMEVLENGAVALLLNFDHTLETEDFNHLADSLPTNGMSVGVGGVCGLDQVPRSFRQSLTAAQMAAAAQEAVLCYRQIQKPSANFYPTISQLRRDLIEALRCIRPDQVDICAQRYFAFLQNQPEKRYEYYNLFSELFILGKQVGCRCVEDAFRPAESASSEEMEQELHKLLFALCADLQAQKINAKKLFKFQVAEYLRLHFSDSMLTVSSVAEHFGVSVSYLDRYFKKYFDNTLTGYLDDIRMEQAALLLSDTREKIKDIVGNVGYVDVNNFNRKFKRKYGMPPSRYRSSRQLADSQDDKLP